MDNPPSPEAGAQTPGTPAPDVLKPRVDTAATTTATPPPETTKTDDKKVRRRSYRPSHRATFIGLGVVVAILAVNITVLGFVLKNKAKKNDLAANGQVTISADVLNKVGINSSNIGDSGAQLIVGPNAEFKNKVTIGSDTSVAGQLKLNGTFTGSDAKLTQLEAGKTSLSQLDVNGDTTLGGLNLRSGLLVTGGTQLQGTVTISQLLTVNNSVNVLGNLSVGGDLSVNKFSVQSLTVNGHLTSSGSTPGVSSGGAALGSNGSVSISGNDSAGRIAINIGAGPSGNGVLANVTFHTAYGATPRVVITPVGIAGLFFLSSVSTGGFSVAVGSSLVAGGYAVDYIVEQ